MNEAAARDDHEGLPRKGKKKEKKGVGIVKKNPKNSRNKEVPYEGRALTLLEYAHVRDEARQVEFQHALRKLNAFSLDVFPQLQRILDNEADVGDVFLSNILNPIKDSLNAFIDPKFRRSFQVEFFSQLRRTETEGEANEDGTSMTLDFAINLVSKPAVPQDVRPLAFSKVLVIIEVKRHALANKKEWVMSENWAQELLQLPRALEPEDGEPYVHMPQILREARIAQCPHVYLSDYVQTIGTYISLHSFKPREEHVEFICWPVAGAGTSHDQRSVDDHGPRLSVAFDVYCELRKLGLLGTHEHLKKYLHP
ncbi:hypothetical protein JCM10449v2_004716 [Rhodotorula kratochvilovae]